MIGKAYGVRRRVQYGPKSTGARMIRGRAPGSTHPQWPAPGDTGIPGRGFPLRCRSSTTSSGRHTTRCFNSSTGATLRARGRPAAPSPWSAGTDLASRPRCSPALPARRSSGGRGHARWDRDRRRVFPLVEHHQPDGCNLRADDQLTSVPVGSWTPPFVCLDPSARDRSPMDKLLLLRCLQAPRGDLLPETAPRSLDVEHRVVGHPGNQRPVRAVGDQVE